MYNSIYVYIIYVYYIIYYTYTERKIKRERVIFKNCLTLQEVMLGKTKSVWWDAGNSGKSRCCNPEFKFYRPDAGWKLRQSFYVAILRTIPSSS